MKLLLIRHAKAKPHSDSGRDFDRKLSRKGQHQAEDLNRWLQQRMQNENLSEWLARYSPAKRTQQTAEAVLRGLDKIEAEADQLIWNADAMTLAAVVRDYAMQKPGILLVGHNPGLEQLVMQLTGQLRPLATGSVTEIAFSDGFKNGRLVTQFRPEIESI